MSLNKSLFKSNYFLKTLCSKLMSFEFYLLFKFFEIEVNQKSYSVFNKKRVREENIKDNV